MSCLLVHMAFNVEILLRHNATQSTSFTDTFDRGSLLLNTDIGQFIRFSISLNFRCRSGLTIHSFNFCGVKFQTQSMEHEFSFPLRINITDSLDINIFIMNMLVY